MCILLRNEGGAKGRHACGSQGPCSWQLGVWFGLRSLVCIYDIILLRLLCVHCENDLQQISGLVTEEAHAQSEHKACHS